MYVNVSSESNEMTRKLTKITNINGSKHIFPTLTQLPRGVWCNLATMRKLRMRLEKLDPNKKKKKDTQPNLWLVAYRHE